MRSLGHILVDRGLLTLEQLQQAEAEQQDSGHSLGRVLISRRIVTEKDLVAALATQIGMSFVDLAEADVDPRATTMVSEKIMRRHSLLPIGFEDGKLVVAMSDPSNVVAMDDVRTITKMEVKPVVATRDDVVHAVSKYASMSEDIEAIADDLIGEADDAALADLEAITEDAAWYCWHASRRQAMLEACWEKAGAFVHQQLIWVKDRGVLTRSHYLWKHEPCFMGWIKGKRPPKVADETPPSTWEMPSFAKDERPDHPTPKPLDAFGIPMRQHVARGGLCYEPFSGSGSQIMAGEANGRRVFAMEISPAYVDVAVERWQTETGRDAILDGDSRSFAEVKAERLGETPAAAEGAHAA